MLGFAWSYNIAWILSFFGRQVCKYHQNSMFMILNSRVISELRYIQATHPVISTPCIAIMSVVWEKSERVLRVLCTRQSIRVPILMPCVIRLRIYICMEVERLMLAFKRHMVSLSW